MPRRADAAGAAAGTEEWPRDAARLQGAASPWLPDTRVERSKLDCAAPPVRLWVLAMRGRPFA